MEIETVLLILVDLDRVLVFIYPLVLFIQVLKILIRRYMLIIILLIIL